MFLLYGILSQNWWLSLGESSQTGLKNFKKDDSKKMSHAPRNGAFLGISIGFFEHQTWLSHLMVYLAMKIASALVFDRSQGPALQDAHPEAIGSWWAPTIRYKWTYGQ